MDNFHEKIALAEEELETMKSKVCAKEKEILQMKEIASKVELALDECYKQVSIGYKTLCVSIAPNIPQVLEKLVRENEELKKTQISSKTSKKAVGGSKKKGEVKNIMTDFKNKVQSRGFNKGECCGVHWKNEDGCKIRIASQCQNEDEGDGLCKKHQKEWDGQGFLRNGRLNPEKNGADIIEPGFLGSVEEYSQFPAGHIRWVRQFYLYCGNCQ